MFVTESRRGSKDCSFSLDRIDSTKGYIKGNVWIISHKANTMKSSSTLQEFELMAQNWRKCFFRNYDLSNVEKTNHE